MNLLRSKVPILKKKSRLPEYVITSRLPASKESILLGRIVANFEDPLSFYRPKEQRQTVSQLGHDKADNNSSGDIPTGSGNDEQQKTDPGKLPSEGGKNKSTESPPKSKTLAESLGGEELEIVDEGFETLFSVTKNTTAQLRVGQIVGVEFDKGQSRSVTVKGKYVRTRTLTQHPDVLDALLKDYREEILDLLRKQKNGRAYMIVGLKTAVDGEFKSDTKVHTTATIKAALPAGAVAQAVSHGTVNPGDKADPQGKFGKDHEASRVTSFGMVGEQIFAVRYRLISLKRPRHGKDEQVNYGEVFRVPETDGVYGEYGSEGQGQVFAENEFDDGSAFQDDDIELLDEGMKSEIKQLGVDVPVIKFQQ